MPPSLHSRKTRHTILTEFSALLHNSPKFAHSSFFLTTPAHRSAYDLTFDLCQNQTGPDLDWMKSEKDPSRHVMTGQTSVPDCTLVGPNPGTTAPRRNNPGQRGPNNNSQIQTTQPSRLTQLPSPSPGDDGGAPTVTTTAATTEPVGSNRPLSRRRKRRPQTA